MSPSPGPTFDIDVAAPDIEVIKSKPVSDNNKDNNKKSPMYRQTKVNTEDKNLSSID